MKSLIIYSQSADHWCNSNIAQVDSVCWTVFANVCQLYLQSIINQYKERICQYKPRINHFHVYKLKSLQLKKKEKKTFNNRWERSSNEILWNSTFFLKNIWTKSSNATFSFYKHHFFILNGMKKFINWEAVNFYKLQVISLELFFEFK